MGRARAVKQPKTVSSGTGSRRARRLLLAAALLFMFFVVAVPALSVSGATWTVNPAGTDTGFTRTTIQKAVDNATAGDIIYILSGTYPEQVNLNKTLSVQGENQNATQIDAPTASGNAITVAANNVNLSTLTVKNSNFGITINTPFTNLAIDLVTFEANTRGLNTNQVNNVTVNNCYFGNHTGASGYGLFISRGTGFVARNNTLLGNQFGFNMDRTISAIVRDSNINGGRFGITLSQTTSTTVDRNHVGNTTTSGYGIGATSDHNSTISSNRVDASANAGLQLDSSFNLIILGNDFDNNVVNFRMLPISNASGRFYGHTIASSNLVDGKPMYYFVNTSNVVVPAGGGWVGAFNVSNITIGAVNVTHQEVGAWFFMSNLVRLNGLNASGTRSGNYTGVTAFNVVNAVFSGINSTEYITGTFLYACFNITLAGGSVTTAPSSSPFNQWAWLSTHTSNLRIVNYNVNHTRAGQIIYGSNNSIEGSVFSNGSSILYLASSSYGRMYSNTFTNVTYHLQVSGATTANFTWDIAPNNTWEGRPFRSYFNSSFFSISQNLAWVLLVNVTNVSGPFMAANPYAGQAMLIVSSADITVGTLFANLSGTGAYVYQSQRVTITNLSTNSSDNAIYAQLSSDITVLNGQWYISESYGVYLESVDRATIRNITQSGPEAGYFFQGYNFNGVVLRNITVTDTYTFAYVEGGNNLSIDRAQVSPGFVIVYETSALVEAYDLENLTVTNSSIDTTYWGIYLGGATRNVVLNNTTILNVRNTAFEFNPQNGYGNVTINGSRFEGVDGWGQEGIRFSDVAGPVVMTGINISRFDLGVVFDPMSGVTISGSQFNNSSYGIYFLYITNSNITSNTITDISYACIWIEASDNINISGNQMMNCGYYGIYITGTPFANITSNIVTNTNDVCLYIYNAAAMAVNNNQFTNCGTFGVQLSYSMLITLTSNTIQGGSYTNTGLYFEGGRNHTATSNLVNGTVGRGIMVSGEHEASVFTGNTVTNSYEGFYLEHSRYLTLNSNTFSGSTFNFHHEWYTTEHFYHRIPTNNTVNGRPIYWIVNGTGGIIPASAGMIYLTSSTNYLASAFSVDHNWRGVSLYDSTFISIINATMSTTAYGAFVWNGANITISDSRFDVLYTGLYVYSSRNLTIARNTFNGSYSGLSIEYSRAAIIDANLFNGTSNYGLQIWATDVSLVTNNRLNNNTYMAFYMGYSSGDTFYNNSMNTNWGSWSIYGYDISHFNHTIAANNTVLGKQVFYRINTTNVVAPANAGMVIFANVTNGTVNGSALNQTGMGVIIWGSHFINITNVTFGVGVYGVWSSYSDHINIRNISMVSAQSYVYTLISLDYMVTDINVSDSNISSAANAISAYTTENLTVYNVTFGELYVSSVSTAISLYGATNHTTIDRVNFSYLYQAFSGYGYDDSTMMKNVTISNSSFGPYNSYIISIQAPYAENVTLYHNNIDKTQGSYYNSVDDQYDVITWYRAYPWGGNYWSNYTSPDTKNGVFQLLPGADGIVDSAMDVEFSTVDQYPLTSPWQPRTVLISPPNLSAIVPGVVLDFDVPAYYDSASYALNNASGVVFGAPFNISTAGWTTGVYHLWVNATDATGNTDRQFFVFAVDTTPPIISVLSPAAGGVYFSGILLNFTITDLHVAPNATWDNGGGPQPFFSQWQIDTAGWFDGNYNITIFAWDTAGNGANATFSYGIDGNAPTISLVTPANLSIIAAGTVLDFDIQDAFLQNASWLNGSTWTALPGPFNVATFGIPDGLRTITVVAIDQLGRRTTRTFDFTFDSTAPSITMNTPANNSITNAGVLNFNVTDANFRNATWMSPGYIGGTWFSINSPYIVNVSPFPDGLTTFYFNAFDWANNGRTVMFSFDLDKTKPTIALLTPANNSVIRPGVALDFSIADVHSVTATWNNGSGPNVFAAPFDVNTLGWAELTFNVTISVTDAANNSNTTVFRFTIDATPPIISLSSPANNSVISAASVLAFSFIELHPGNYSWINASGGAALLTPFTLSVAGWPDGSTTVRVFAFDAAGNNRTDFFVFTNDQTAPTINLLSPVNGSILQSGAVMDFQVIDPNLFAVMWDNGGSQTTLSSPYDIDTSGWAEGTYSVRVVAADSANNARVHIAIITLDNTDPVISLNQPTNGSTFGAGTTIDLGISDLHSIVGATWDNGSGQVAFSSPFDVVTNGWAGGSVTLVINASDVAGNFASAFFVFTIDNAFPAVILVSPANNSVIVSGVVLDFDIVDGDLNTVTYNDGSGAVTFSAPYNFSTSSWGEGGHDITIVATDNATHVVSILFHFTVDNTLPTVTLVTPANLSVIQAGVALDFTVADTNLGQVTWRNTTSGPFLLNAPFDVSTIGWADGSITVEIVALDLAGNSRTSSFYFTIDSTPPTISMTSPANNSLVVPGTNLTFAITDLNLNVSSVRWDNSSGLQLFSTQWVISTAGWADATFFVLVQATDLAGNSIYRIFTVEFDGTFPFFYTQTWNNTLVQAGAQLPINASDTHLAWMRWDNGAGANANLSVGDGLISTAGWSDATYTISAEASDTLGHRVTATFIINVDSTPPVISVVTPANNSVIAPGTTIDFSITDAHSFTATIDDGSGPVPFTAPFDFDTSALSDGLYTLTITATDCCANVATYWNYQFTVDATPPLITILSPNIDSIIRIGDTIDFDVVDTHGLSTVTWDIGLGATTLASPFDLVVGPWADGDVNVSIDATDSVGNGVVLTIHFVVDSTGPTVSLLSPPTATVIRPGTNLSFNITDLHGLGLVTFTNGTGPYNLTAPFNISTAGWANGVTTVTINALDSVGNLRTVVYNWTIDGLAPAIQFVSPANNSVVQVGAVIDVEIVELHLASVSFNNGSGFQPLNSPWNIATALWGNGTFNVTVHAVDAAGNQFVDVFHITLDSSRPTITLVAPSNGSIIAQGSLLDFSIVELNLNNVTWSNGSGNNPLLAPFDIATSGWAETTFTVWVNATDLAGNQQSASFTFTVDATLPLVALIGPGASSVIQAGTTLDFDVSDYYLSNVTWNNGSGPILLASPFDVDTTGWSDGTRNVTITAVDLAGNTRALTVQFTFDSTLPSIVVVTPPDASVIASGTLIDLTVSDLHLDFATWNNGSGSNSLPSPHNIATTGWGDGYYNITVTARDLAGNQRVVVLRYTVDATAPSLSLLSPQNNSIIPRSGSLDFDVTDFTTLTVTYDRGSGFLALSAPYDLAINGTWSDGDWNVTVRAVDQVGFITIRTFHVVVDGTSPSIAAVSHGNNSYIQRGATISFSISDAHLLPSNVTWNNGGGATTFAAQWSFVLNWADGIYNLTLSAEDAAGNIQTLVLHYTIDTVAPSVALSGITNNSTIRSGRTIDFTITDVNLDLTSVSWDDGSGSQPFLTQWTISTTGWAEGIYLFHIVAGDLAGNVTHRYYRFVIDNTLPTVNLLSPVNNTVIAPGTDLNFAISDVNLNFGSVSWDDGSGDQPFATSWTISTTGWTDGVYWIYVNATDNASNLRVRLFRWTIDGTQPTLPTQLWNNTVVDAGTLLSINATDAFFAWMRWDNGVTNGIGSSPNATIDTTGWIDGLYTITVTASDTVGHLTVATYRVTIDTIDPVLNLLSPQSGSFVKPGVWINFTATDSNLLSVTWRRGTETALNANNTGPHYAINTSVWGSGTWDVALIVRDRAGHQVILNVQIVTDNLAPTFPAFPILNTNEDVLTSLDGSGTSDGGNPLDNSSFTWSFSDTSTTLTGPVQQRTWATPGNYNVTLTVRDMAGNVGSTTFQVHVNDTTLPTAIAGSDQVVDEDTTVTLDGTGSSDNDPAAVLTFLWTQVGGPAASFNAFAAVTSFVPQTPGIYVFRLDVTDSSSLTGQGFVTIEVDDITPPSIVMANYPMFNQGTEVWFNASDSRDNDPSNATALTFQWSFTYGEPQFLSGGLINWTFGNAGLYPVVLTVTDAHGNSNMTSFVLHINDIPSLATTPPGTIELPGTYFAVLDIADIDAGDRHNVTVNAPVGMTVIQQAGRPALQWQPEVIGFYVVNLTISDGWSSAAVTYNLRVTRTTTGNSPPVFTTSPVMEAVAGQIYRYTPRATDADNNSLLFGFDVSPPNMTISASTGAISWIHGYISTSGDHTDNVSLWVWDGAFFVYQNFSIRFLAAGNNPPTIDSGAINSSYTIPTVGGSFTIPLGEFVHDSNDGTNLLVSVVSDNPGVVSATVTGTPGNWVIQVSGNAKGFANLTISVTDPSGRAATQTVPVAVAPGGTAPTPTDAGIMGLLPYIAAGVAAAGLLGFVMVRRRKKDEQPEVALAEARPGAEVIDPRAVEVRAPSSSVSVAPAAAAATAAAAAAAAGLVPEKKVTYTIEGLFVIYKDGRLLFSKTDMGGHKFEDPELVSSMFTAVQSFIKDSFAAEGELNKMGYGDNQIIIERGRSIFMAAIVYGEPDQEFIDTVKETIEKLELSYAGIIEEWDGMMDSFSDMAEKVTPIIALTAGISRREVQMATTKQEVQMLSELEFFQGFVRLKCGIKNNTPMVITKCTVDIEYNEDVLRLGKVEPAAYRTSGAKVLLGVLNPGEKSSVAYYFDPQICTESQIDGVCRYRDAQGVLHTVAMKTRKAEVVCPLFFTKEHANTAMLKRLVESELSEKDAKVFEIQKVPPYIKYKDIFDLVKSVVNAHDVQMVREFTKFNTFQGEAWFYGETKVKGYKIVIRASVIEETSTIEFFAASTNMKAITGLLAEFNHTLNTTLIEKYSDLKIALTFDQGKKAEIDKKSLMSNMSSAELEGGETDQPPADAAAAPSEPAPPEAEPPKDDLGPSHDSEDEGGPQDPNAEKGA